MPWSDFHDYFIKDDELDYPEMNTIDIHFHDNSKVDMSDIRHSTIFDIFCVNLDDIKFESKTLDMENLVEVVFNLLSEFHIHDKTSEEKRYKIIINGKIYETNKKVITKKDIIELYENFEEPQDVYFHNLNNHEIEDFRHVELHIHLQENVSIFYIQNENLPIGEFEFTINGIKGKLPFQKVSMNMVANEMLNIWYHPHHKNVKIPTESILKNKESKFFYIPTNKFYNNLNIPVCLSENSDEKCIDLLEINEFYFI